MRGVLALERADQPSGRCPRAHSRGAGDGCYEATCSTLGAACSTCRCSYSRMRAASAATDVCSTPARMASNSSATTYTLGPGLWVADERGARLRHGGEDGELLALAAGVHPPERLPSTCPLLLGGFESVQELELGGLGLLKVGRERVLPLVDRLGERLVEHGLGALQAELLAGETTLCIGEPTPGRVLGRCAGIVAAGVERVGEQRAILDHAPARSRASPPRSFALAAARSASRSASTAAARLTAFGITRSGSGWAISARRDGRRGRRRSRRTPPGSRSKRATRAPARMRSESSIRRGACRRRPGGGTADTDPDASDRLDRRPVRPDRRAAAGCLPDQVVHGGHTDRPTRRSDELVHAGALGSPANRPPWSRARSPGRSADLARHRLRVGVELVDRGSDEPAARGFVQAVLAADSELRVLDQLRGRVGVHAASVGTGLAACSAALGVDSERCYASHSPPSLSAPASRRAGER